MGLIGEVSRANCYLMGVVVIKGGQYPLTWDKVPFLTRKVFSLTHSHHEWREAEQKRQRKWNLISLFFQGNQSAPQRSSYGERYKSSYGERYTSLSIVVYWLFVRTIGFKILLFPIIDSLGNPLRIFTGSTPFFPKNWIYTVEILRNALLLDRGKIKSST